MKGKTTTPWFTNSLVIAAETLLAIVLITTTCLPAYPLELPIQEAVKQKHSQTCHDESGKYHCPRLSID